MTTPATMSDLGHSSSFDILFRWEDDLQQLVVEDLGRDSKPFDHAGPERFDAKDLDWESLGERWG